MKIQKDKVFTLKHCFQFGLYGNIAYILFIIACLLYYWLVTDDLSGGYYLIFEIPVLMIELVGFVCNLLAVICCYKVIQNCYWLKRYSIFYLIMEFVLMLVDFRFINITSYTGLELWLTILHVFLSAISIFFFVLLDSENSLLQVSVGISTAISLSGFFVAALGFRVYGSILVNAIAYVVLYKLILYYLEREELTIECYGDPLRVSEFKSSSFFN